VEGIAAAIVRADLLPPTISLAHVIGPTERDAELLAEVPAHALLYSALHVLANVGTKPPGRFGG